MAWSNAPQFVSTGALPARERVRALVDEAHERFLPNDDGAVSDVYPALAAVEPGLYGICVVSAAGELVAAGDTEVELTIMSVSKPFVFALVCAERGPEEVRELVGVNATGLAFNSLEAVEQGDQGRTNPMVNPGAIATTSLVPGGTSDERWAFVLDGLSRFAGGRRSLDDAVYRSATETNHVNRSIASLLASRGRIVGDSAEALDLYTRQSSVAVTARDLATMGATLADGGVNPFTRERVVDAATCRHARPGGDDDRRPVRELGRLALRRRPAGEERHRWRDRHGRTGEGRAWDVLAAPRRGGEQRARPARRAVPLTGSRARSLRIRAHRTVNVRG